MQLTVYDLEVSGLMAFAPRKPQKLHLHTNQLTAILGENLDAGNGERNGAGKSAIIDALSYAWFGQARTANKALLNYIDPGPLLVKVTSIIGDLAFRVERGEKPSLLRLFEIPDRRPGVDDLPDEEDWYRRDATGKFQYEKTASSKAETTRRVQEILGFDIKLFEILIASTASETSCFFLKNEEDRRAIIERIFGFTIFTEKADHLRETRKDEKARLDAKESARIATEEANLRIAREITHLEQKADSWAADRDATIRILTDQIQRLEGIDFTTEVSTLQQIEEQDNLIAQWRRDLQSVTRSLESNKKQMELWEHKHKSEIVVLETEIAKLSAADPEADIAAIKAREPVLAAIDQLAIEIPAAAHEIAAATRLLDEKKTQHRRLLREIEEVEGQLITLSDAKCPTCGQDWTESHDHLLTCIKLLDDKAMTVEGSRAEIQRLNSGLVEQNEEHQNRLALKAELEKTLVNLPSPKSFTTVEAAATCHTRIAEKRQNLSDLRMINNPYQSNVEQLLQQYTDKQTELHTGQTNRAALHITYTPVYESVTEAKAAARELTQKQDQLDDLNNHGDNPYRETIENLRQQALKTIDDSDINELRKRQEHMKLLIELLADRKSPIRKQVLSEWLPRLNNLVAHHLLDLELPHQIVFDPDTSANFTLNGATLGFGNLSTGQRLRVWLATNLAFREIFELINYRINLFFVDELLDKGMSPRGAELSYGLLQRLAAKGKSVFLISHRTELVDMADDVITVVLENNLSTILN